MMSPASTSTTSPTFRLVPGTILYLVRSAPVSSFACVSVRVRRSESACALPRPSATASAKFANSTVNQSHSDDLEREAEVLAAGREVAQEDHGGQRGDDLDHEHDRVLHHDPWIELGESGADRRHDDLRIDQAPMRASACAVSRFPLKSAPNACGQNIMCACIARCSTIGPSASAGKKVRPPMMRITPTSRPTNRPPVGREGAGGGRHRLLGGQRAGDRHRRDDHQIAADQHREAAGRCCTKAYCR